MFACPATPLTPCPLSVQIPLHLDATTGCIQGREGRNRKKRENNHYNTAQSKVKET